MKPNKPLTVFYIVTKFEKEGPQLKGVYREKHMWRLAEHVHDMFDRRDKSVRFYKVWTSNGQYTYQEPVFSLDVLQDAYVAGMDFEEEAPEDVYIVARRVNGGDEFRDVTEDRLSAVRAAKRLGAGWRALRFHWPRLEFHLTEVPERRSSVRVALQRSRKDQ